MVDDVDDPRRKEPAPVLGEREMLEGWLEGWLEDHRTTMLLRYEGVDDAGRKNRPVPTAKLSLHGLVRRMTEVECGWFRCVPLQEPDAPAIFCDPAVEDSELVPLDGAALRYGEPCSLRWIYVHMITST